MTKQLSKEIMTSSRLRNNFMGNRAAENKILYNKQRNYGENRREDTMKTLI